jgi:guanine deaminase
LFEKYKRKTQYMKQAYRAEILDFINDPVLYGLDAMRHFSDGLLVIEAGKVVAVGDAATLLPLLETNTPIHDYRPQIIMPGLIDTHIHYPQCEVIASYGAQLLDWLNTYTFPAEGKFSDFKYAQSVAKFFIDELHRNGTTTAMVFASVHPHSVDALCEAAGDMRLIVGKVLMDRNAPQSLCDSAASTYDDNKTLIKRWHGQKRLSYALTPRFAPTSTDAQLQAVQALHHEFPDVHLQTHVAENKEEVAWVAELFPWSRSYLDVYDHYDLLFERALFAHCLYLNDTDRARLGESGAAIAFCPSSNLFLGSGLFDLQAAQKYNIQVGIASDVGGGTSFSILQNLSDAYKVLQLKQQAMPARQGLYLATLGGARALKLDTQIGNFEVGKEADFIVIDPDATRLTAQRMAHATNIDERLFALMMLGDDRHISATYILGEAVYTKPFSTLQT